MQALTTVLLKRMLLLLLGGGAALALAIPGKSFAQSSSYVFRVETDVQREFVPKHADVFVLIDAASFATSDLSTLKRELAPYKNADKHIHVRIFQAKRKPEAFSLFRYALIGFLHDSGFESFSADGQFSNVGTTWDTLTKNFRSRDDAPAKPEPATLKNGVTAYPILNPLSKFLTSDADCVLIVPAIQLDGGVLPESIVYASADAVASLGLDKRGSVKFLLRDIEDGQLALVTEEIFELGKLLQFDSTSVTR